TDMFIDFGTPRFRRRYTDLLQHVIEPPRVAVGGADQSMPRVIRKVQSFQCASLRPLEQLPELLIGERLQNINGSARQQCAIDFERRILRCRADESKKTPLDVRQESAVPRLVEA